MDFPAFNLIQQTPQDIMHVILEGIAPLEFKYMLKQLVILGQLNLDAFNADIIGFPYSPQDTRDRPCPNAYSTLASNDNKLKQSSGQMHKDITYVSMKYYRGDVINYIKLQMCEKLVCSVNLCFDLFETYSNFASSIYHCDV